MQELYSEDKIGLNEMFVPRESGSLEWRSSRAEMGSDVMSMMPGFSENDKITGV